MEKIKRAKELFKKLENSKRDRFEEVKRNLIIQESLKTLRKR